jgi:5-methylcytosine-specific restriction endonuclease McrA
MHKAFKGKQKCVKIETPYSNLQDHSSVGPGKRFTSTQKNNIRNANMQRNDGILIDDDTGDFLVLPQKHMKGETPPWNEAHIDHIKPKSKGGTNSYSNTKVISRRRNLSKGNR